jgi:hypothetical protein
MKHKFLTDEQLQQYDQNIDEDISKIFETGEIPQSFKNNETLREVSRAGLWVAEQLDQLGCNPILIARIQFTVGGLSFGRDPWEVAQEVLEAYKNNDLEFEIDYDA